MSFPYKCLATHANALEVDTHTHMLWTKGKSGAHLRTIQNHNKQKILKSTKFNNQSKYSLVRTKLLTWVL